VAFAALERLLERSAAAAESPVDIEGALRQAARDAAAERVPAPATPGSRLRRLSGRGATCELMPRLLAARASGRLADADADAVGRHLLRCSGCEALERRHSEAERAYDGLLRDAAIELAALERDARDEITVTRVDGYAAASGADGDAAAEPVAAPAPPEALPAAHAPVEEPAAPAGQPAAVEEHEAAEEPAAPAPRPSSPRSRPAAVLAAGGLLAAAAGAIAIASGGSGGSGDRVAAATGRAALPQPADQASPATAAAERRSAVRARTRARVRAMGDRILGPGATGPDVRTLQRLIGVSPTGAYGAQTQAAVLQFQQANGLHADGNAGDATKRLLARRPPTS
jgi:hypothetical protein